jgi:hypothetical protein
MNSPIPCKNPTHPNRMPRASMRLVKEDQIEEVWACAACLDAHKVYSVQVRTKPEFRQHTRSQLAKEGRLLNSAPRTIRPHYAPLKRRP